MLFENRLGIVSSVAIRAQEPTPPSGNIPLEKPSSRGKQRTRDKTDTTPMTFEEIVRAKEKTLRRLRSEAGSFYDQRGTLIEELKADAGSSYELVVPDALTAKLKGIGNVTFTHNHPRGWRYAKNDPRRKGFSFSPNDILLACRAELSEIRAVSPGYIFSMKPSPAGWSEALWPLVETIYLRERALVDGILINEVLQGKITSAQYHADIEHETWVRVANLLGFAYNRFEE
jgi:hypothetical protein